MSRLLSLPFASLTPRGRWLVQRLAQRYSRRLAARTATHTTNRG